MSAKKKHRDNAPVNASAPTDCASVPTSAEFCAQLRQHLAAELARPHGKGGSKTNFQAFSAKLVQLAVGGSKDAIHVLLDRLAGRTPQAASESGDGPVHIEYVLGIPRPDHDDPENATTADGVRAVSPAE